MKKKVLVVKIMGFVVVVSASGHQSDKVSDWNMHVMGDEEGAEVNYMLESIILFAGTSKK